MVLGFLYDIATTRSTKTVLSAIKEIDYFTLLLLAGLFVVIAGISRAGVVDEISAVFVRLSGNNVFVIYTLIDLFFIKFF